MKWTTLAIFCICALASCQQRNNGQEPEWKKDNASDTTGISTLAGDMPKLIKKAELKFEVGDVQRGSQSIGQLARDLGGMLSYARISAQERERRTLAQGDDSLQVLSSVDPQAQLTVRIPAQRLQEFLYGATQLATFATYSELQVDDAALAYLEAQWRKEAREKVLARASGPRDGRIDTAGLALRDAIVNNRLLQKSIDGEVRYSTVNLELQGAPLLRRTVIVNTDLEAYGQPFGKRLLTAGASGWAVLENILVACAHAWTLLLLALACWLGYRAWLQRRASAAIAAK